MNPARHQRICAEIQEAHKKEIEKMTAELVATKKAVQQNYFRVVEVTAELKTACDIDQELKIALQLAEAELVEVKVECDYWYETAEADLAKRLAAWGELARAKQYHAAELADVTAERDSLKSAVLGSKALMAELQSEIDYAIGLQRAIEAHYREDVAPDDVAPDDVCPHHAEKLNGHFNRQQVLEKEHKEFYDEVVKLRTIVEHLRLREDHLTAELAEMKADRDSLSVAAALWNHRYIDACQQHADRQTNLGHQIVALEAERDAIHELMSCYNLGGWTDALALIKERDSLKSAVLGSKALMAELQSERVALAADAARYRWLKSGCENATIGVWNCLDEQNRRIWLAESELDDAIDAAIQGAGK